MAIYILVGDSFTSFSKEVAFANDVAIAGNKKEIKKYRELLLQVFPKYVCYPKS